MGEQAHNNPHTGRHIKYVPLTEIRRADRNAKAHDITWIKSLIAKFGFVGSAIHDNRTGKIIAGHGRLESLEQMAYEGQTPPDGITTAPDGTWMMPVEYGWSSRSDHEAEALGLALNEATTRGGWDDQLLAETLHDLDTIDADLRRIAGWDDKQLAELETLTQGLDDDPGEGDTDPDDIPEPPAEPHTRRGDLWLLGPHRLLCADSGDETAVTRLLDGRSPTVLLMDPPYGMRLDTDFSSVKSRSPRSHWAGRGGNTYKPVAGDDEDYDPGQIMELFSDVGEQFWWGADYYAERIPRRTDGSWLVWDKRTGSQADAFGSEFELCWSKTGHKRRVLRHEWFGFTSSESPQEARNRAHPTQKPVALYIDILKQWGGDAGTILDLYAGSGTTLIAAHRVGATAMLSEIDPHYVDVVCRRWQEHTGDTPVHAATGERVDFTTGK